MSIAVALSLAAPAIVSAAESSYTSIAGNQCRKLSTFKVDDSEYAASRVCPGRSGCKVYIDEDDLRETLTVGKTMQQAGKEPAARERFGAFNGYEETIEWRAANDGTPYALIVGWSFADNDNLDAKGRPKDARLLVVMRLPPGPVCKVAYIDRAANGDANTLARQAADEAARSFRCGTDKVAIVGNRGPAIDALSRLSDKP